MWLANHIEKGNRESAQQHKRDRAESTSGQRDFRKAYGKIVAKAWADEGFKQRLLSDATTALRENGIDVPEGAKFMVAKSMNTLIHLILPAKPVSGEVAAETLEIRVAAFRTAG